MILKYPQYSYGYDGRYKDVDNRPTNGSIGGGIYY